MQELLGQIRAIIQGIWRFRWQAVIAAWVMSLAGWAFVYSLPDVYESHARVFVDVQTALKPLLQGLTIQPDVISEVNLLTEALLSQPNLEKMIRDTDMQLRATTPLETKQLIDTLKKKIHIDVGNRANLYDITYQDSEPRMANAVVQTLLNNLIDETLGKQRTDTITAQDFIGQQVKDYEAKLSKAEQQLAEFKKQKIGLMPENRQGYFTRLQLATQKHQETLLALKLASDNMADLQKQIAGEEPVFGLLEPASPIVEEASTSKADDEAPIAVPAGNPTTSVDADLHQAEDLLDQLSTRYTDKYPDVIVTKKRVEQLKQRQQEERTSAKHVVVQRPRAPAKPKAVKPQAPPPLNQNPVYQNMRIGITDAQVQVTALTAQAAEEQTELDEINKSLNDIPTVEADLARLTRDYDLTKVQYDALSQRLDTARLSDDASKSSEIKFRIIEPPSLPIKPIGPNRPLFLTVVLGAGIFLGIALAFVQHQFRPVFINSRGLRTLTGLPVFGTVTFKRQPAQIMRARTGSIVLALSLMLLLSAYGGAMLLNKSGAQALHSVIKSGAWKHPSLLKGGFN